MCLSMQEIHIPCAELKKEMGLFLKATEKLPVRGV